uniref:Uncharacterized protein n=1 Tax=Panagrolaimus superbus TaxID=310955 RepID=A0A914YKB0_9BILA
MDAELSKYLINSNKNVCIVLNKSDEMIDNLKKQQNFFGNDDYVRKRLEGAQREFVKVGIEPINLPCFSVSTFVLTGFLDNTYNTEEQAFLNYLRHVLCRKA